VPFPGTEAYTLLPGFKPSSNPWDTDIATTATDRLKSGGASLTVNTSLPFAQLESISAYRQFAFLAHFTPTASPYPGQDLHPDQAGEQATEELQLVSPDSSVVKWATGVYYFYDSEGTGPGEQINLLPPFFGPTVTAIVNKTQTITNSIAGFGQVTAPLPMLDKTNITAGIRYTHERRNFAGSESVDGVLVPLPPIATTITASRPTWRLALDHNFTDDLLGYVSYSTGFKSGGYNGFDPTNPPYRPETVNAYEGGFKSEFFDRTVRVNAAAFYDTYKNIQVSRYTTTSVIYNGASAKIYGLDLDAETRLGNLKLGGGIELLHTDFTSFASAACSAPNFPLPGITQFSCSATGNRLPYAPQFTGTLTTDYFQSVPGGTLDFNITDYYNSGYFVEPDNRLSQRAYDLLNASIAWKSADDRYSVRLYATNLLDKAVFSFAGTNATQYSADYGNPPRLVGVHLDYGF
jgi:outer membrane receptor protein involved in Fe transport